MYEVYDAEWAQWLIKQAYRGVPATADLARKICITPITGHYGLWAYAVVLEGSPPHGVAILTCGNPHTMVLFNNQRATTRKGYTFTGNRTANKLAAFLNECGLQTDSARWPSMPPGRLYRHPKTAKDGKG